MMKLHFEPNLDYQLQAIEAVCDLFRGQEINRTEFTVTRQAAGGAQQELGLVENALGIGNRLTLGDINVASWGKSPYSRDNLSNTLCIKPSSKQLIHRQGRFIFSLFTSNMLAWINPFLY